MSTAGAEARDPAAGTVADDDFAAAFLHDLVAIPSISGDERTAAERFVHAAREIGLEAGIDEAGNAVAMRPATSPDSYEIVLLGHIDTVPGEIPVRIEDGVLHGRGSVDAKGPLAAMLIAAARARIDPRMTIHIIGAVGEETPESPGARHIIGRYRPAACIIGEPSGTSGYVLGYKGRLIVETEFRVPCSHSAGPHGSAADAAFLWWRAVLERIAALNSGREGAFATIQASLRALRSDSDGLHDSAVLTAGFRLPPGLVPAALEAELTGITGTALPSRLTFIGHTQPIRAERGNNVAAALSAAIRDEGMVPRPLHKTGTSDMNIAGPAWGCPIAAYGPGDSALDHTPEEQLALDDYLRAIRVLERALASLGGLLLRGGD